jgi:hypothetical protein
MKAKGAEFILYKGRGDLQKIHKDIINSDWYKSQLALSPELNP